MRLIPGKTKVQIELFKGISVADILIAIVSAIVVIFVFTSSIPGKIYIGLVLALIAILLLVRLDEEPNYIYLLHILRHFGYVLHYRRARSDSEILTGEKNTGNNEEIPEQETPEQRRERLKAEKAERKADDKILKDKNATKAQKDAIWLKRANQSAARSKEKAEKKKVKTAEVKNIIAFTGIDDNVIEYAGEYFGAVLEIDPVEFRLFTPYRRNYSIESGLGKVLRVVPADYGANIVKIERPVIYDKYLENEYKKIDDVRASYEQGMITEEELQVRIEILCERINDLRTYRYEEQIVQPFYYLVLFDADKAQLNVQVSNAIAALQSADIHSRRLNTKQLAVFLKYNNRLDFDEREIEKIDPSKYAEWAMPESIDFSPRKTTVDSIVTHNLRVVRYPSQADDAWMASVMSLPSTKVVVKCKPMDHDRAVRNIDNSITELRGQFASTGIESKRIELQSHIDSLSELLATLQSANESLLEVNIYVTGYDLTATKLALGEKGEKLKSSLYPVNGMRKLISRTYQENNLRLKNLEFDQVNAFIGSQISAWDPFHSVGRGIPSNSIAAMYPWIFAHIADEKGVKIGSSDGVPVFVDFFRRDSERVNSNMVIVGKSGSGKSYATKSILTNLAADDSKIFILDPENEYTELAHNLHGKFINVGNSKFGRLNPFHIITALEDDEATSNGNSGSYSTHLQFLEEFFRQILPDCDKDAMEYLNAIIDRLYTSKGITETTDLSKLRPEDYPVFDDLYDAVLAEFQASDNEYIRSMLRTLMNYISKFSSGGRDAAIWNGPSSITTEENFTVFNFQSLLANRNGSIANAQMLLVLKYIDNEIIKNREYNIKYGLKRKVVVVIDEAHVFIDTKYPVALDFMFQLAKRIRKYNGMQIVITQNIKDFVGSEEIARKSTAIINACQYSFIFSLAPNDMADLCKLYEKAGGINESEQDEIVSAPRGQAFAVMSPQSRSTFRVEVPSDTVALFHDGNYKTRYFAGEDGREEWEKILGDSRKIREQKVRKNAPEPVDEIKDVPSDSVTFVEISGEEADREDAAKRSSVKTPETENEETFVFEEYSEEELPVKKHDPIRNEIRTEPVVMPQVVVQAPAASDETEKVLAQLLNQFSHDSMIEEIRRSVRDEFEKEYAARLAAAGMNAAASEPVSAHTDLLDQDEEPAAEPAEESAPAETAEESNADTEEKPFDLMDILMFEAKNTEDMSPIDMMVEYDEDFIEIKLEELVSYNARH